MTEIIWGEERRIFYCVNRGQIEPHACDRLGTHLIKRFYGAEVMSVSVVVRFIILYCMFLPPEDRLQFR